MYHYTYIIQDKETKMRYIGVRSSTLTPTEDTNYWGSSKYLPNDVKDTHSKIILKVFNNREDAVKHEIELHELNDVAVSNEYYNRSKQTSTKFDTTGITYSCTEAKKKRISEGNKGKIRTEVMCKAMSERQKGKRMSDSAITKMVATYKANGKTKGIKHHNFKPWYVSTPNVTHLYLDITKSEQSVLEGHYNKFYADLVKRQNKTGGPVKTYDKGLIFIGNLPNQYKI